MNREEIKRGEIYYYDFGERAGSIQSGYRPVIILQDSHLNSYAPTVTVAAMTTAVKKRYLPTHVVIGTSCGLKEPSMVLLEQMQTVNKNQLKKYIGKINDPNVWKEINRGIRLMFSLQAQRGNARDIRCLCSRCKQDYMNNAKYIVRRVDPLKKEKERCDKCNNLGYEYFVYEKVRRKKKPVNPLYKEEA